jgi:cysteine desulfurase
MNATRIYLDFNASTPLAPEVIEAMRPFLTEHFGNPSSHHWAGAPAKVAVERARAQVVALLGCDPDEVVFTSGGTESNNHALKGVYFANRDRGNHIVTTAVEHPAVLQPLRFLERLGATVTILPVDRAGRVDPDDVRKALTPQTILVSVMHANNEVGTIQPIAEIAAITRAAGVLLHTDAAQSVGKIPTRVNDLGVDLLSVAGHKLYAPKGIGALFIRRGTSSRSCTAPGTSRAGARGPRTCFSPSGSAPRARRRRAGWGCRPSGSCATGSRRGSRRTSGRRSP